MTEPREPRTAAGREYLRDGIDSGVENRRVAILAIEAQAREQGRASLDVERLGYQQRPRWWDRGAWTHYTTHQVGCAVPPWAGNSEATCTCGYTRLVTNALRDEAEYARLAADSEAK